MNASPPLVKRAERRHMGNEDRMIFPVKRRTNCDGVREPEAGPWGGAGREVYGVNSPGAPRIRPHGYAFQVKLTHHTRVASVLVPTVPSKSVWWESSMAQDGASGDAAGLRTFEEAKSTLYGTISAAGAALDKASRCGYRGCKRAASVSN